LHVPTSIQRPETILPPHTSYTASMSTFMAVIMSTFGKRVRQLRLRKKLSQERLADLAGLHVTFVGAIERGRRNLSLVTIVKLAKALKVKPGALFRGIRT
jgi:DNA-binding XRE family transcriptional regulator